MFLPLAGVIFMTHAFFYGWPFTFYGWPFRCIVHAK
jgi:hypothetical protein